MFVLLFNLLLSLLAYRKRFPSVTQQQSGHINHLVLLKSNAVHRALQHAECDTLCQGGEGDEDRIY